MSTEPEIKETNAAETGEEERRADRPDSTAEVAKDLERSGRRATSEDAAATLFPESKANDFRKRWTDIQTGFVDEPRRSVEDADSLVAQAMKRVAEVFAEERAQLERQWSQGQDVSTEDLRVALRRYRSFFDRLLSV